MYKDIEKRRKATRERVRRYRNKGKDVTPTENVTPIVTPKVKTVMPDVTPKVLERTETPKMMFCPKCKRIHYMCRCV